MTRFEYQEAGPQLLLQAFLQRIVNSGGRIEREYGLAQAKPTKPNEGIFVWWSDLLIVWPQDNQTYRVVIECKLLHKSLEQTIADGLEQTAGTWTRTHRMASHCRVGPFG